MKRTLALLLLMMLATAAWAKSHAEPLEKEAIDVGLARTSTREGDGEKAQPSVEGVNLANGNLVQRYTDFAVPGANLTWAFTRTYNNQDNSVSTLGVGWTHNWEAYVLGERSVDLTKARARPPTSTDVDRYTVVIGGQAYDFEGCPFTAGLCASGNGLHGAQLRVMVSPDTTQLGFEMTEASGVRWRFTREGGSKVGYIDGDPTKPQRLLRSWLVTSMAPNTHLKAYAADFGAADPTGWVKWSYESDANGTTPTDRVSTITQAGLDGVGLVLSFTYGEFGGDIPYPVRQAATVKGLRPLERVTLKTGMEPPATVYQVEFIHDGRHNLSKATLSGAGASSPTPVQRWEYTYVPSGVSFREWNELHSAVLEQAQPSDGGLVAQATSTFGRGVTAAPFSHVFPKEMVDSVVTPGHGGVATTVKYTDETRREVTLPSAESVAYGLDDYGAATTVKKGTLSSDSDYSPQAASGLKPLSVSDGTLTTKPDLDSRLRPGVSTLLQGYTGANFAGSAFAASTALSTVTWGTGTTGGQTPESVTSGPHRLAMPQNPSGDVQSVTLETTASPGPGTASYTLASSIQYDDFGRAWAWLDAMGRTVETLEFDSVFQRPKRVKVSKGSAAIEYQYDFDEFGHVTKTTDTATMASWGATYDALGRTLRAWWPGE